MLVQASRQEAADGAKKGAAAFYFAIFFCKDYRKNGGRFTMKCFDLF
jgi:hypothetical protein